MKKISFICCYTNEQMLADLKSSTACLEKYEIEWIVIDNRGNKFTSCASALNYGFSKSSSNVVIFLHQDIVINDQVTIDRVVHAAEKGNVVGLAGRLPNGGAIVSSISEGKDKDRQYDFDFSGKEWINVMTCDECFIAMSRKTFEDVGGFDSINFDGWHLYVVDLTLRAAQKNVPVVVVRANAWHRSHGSIDMAFDHYKNVLRKKYKRYYKKIYYPCGWTYTNSLLYYCRLIARTIKNSLKKDC